MSSGGLEAGKRVIPGSKSERMASVSGTAGGDTGRARSLALAGGRCANEEEVGPHFPSTRCR